MLHIEEIVEWFIHAGDAAELHRSCGDEQAPVFRVHEEFAERGDLAPVLHLAGEDLAEVFQHDDKGAPASLILLAEGGHERVDDGEIVLLGQQLRVQLRPERFPWDSGGEDFAKTEQEIGE